MANLKKPKCKQCKFWEYTKTLGSPVVPVWHCRSGFTPWADAFGSCIKRADREIYYRTEWDGKYGKCSHSVKLSEIDNKNVSFKKDPLLKEYEIRKKRYLDLYAPREGCTPCAYCGKQVPNDKLVKHRIIFQGLVNGKRKLKEQVMNFCSGECAMNEQCSREG